MVDKRIVQKKPQTRKGGKKARGNKSLRVIAENKGVARYRPHLATVERIRMGAKLDQLDLSNLELFEEVARAFDEYSSGGRTFKGFAALFAVPPGGGQK